MDRSPLIWPTQTLIDQNTQVSDFQGQNVGAMDTNPFRLHLRWSTDNCNPFSTVLEFRPRKAFHLLMVSPLSRRNPRLRNLSTICHSQGLFPSTFPAGTMGSTGPVKTICGAWCRFRP